MEWTLKNKFFSVGRPKDRPCQPTPPMYNVGSVCLVYKCSPAFSITPRTKTKVRCDGPGPKYLPEEQKCCKTPGFSFGIKHSECSGIARTECDDLC